MSYQNDRPGLLSSESDVNNNSGSVRTSMAKSFLSL